ncbi:MAG: hypothetical protein LBV06_07045 [Propionibacteriaceae bacterium]|jgi:hypothetical protein|nr:hypothetical protein [Propionibacteriaceae bacterium]
MEQEVTGVSDERPGGSGGLRRVLVDLEESGRIMDMPVVIASGSSIQDLRWQVVDAVNECLRLRAGIRETVKFVGGCFDQAGYVITDDPADALTQVGEQVDLLEGLL